MTDLDDAEAINPVECPIPRSVGNQIRALHGGRSDAWLCALAPAVRRDAVGKMLGNEHANMRAWARNRFGI